MKGTEWKPIPEKLKFGSGFICTSFTTYLSNNHSHRALIQSTTLAFSTSLNTDHFWSPIWLYRANKQHCPNFWLLMDHPFSASLSLIGFIHFNTMPMLHFPVLNVADPLSVLSFSYLNLTWLNAQCFMERQQFLRWFITQHKHTQAKAGEDNRTKDTTTGRFEWRRFISLSTMNPLFLIRQVQYDSIAAHSAAIFFNGSQPFAVDAPSGFGRIFSYMRWLPSPTHLHPQTTLETHGTGSLQCWKQAVITNGSIIILINAAVDYNFH